MEQAQKNHLANIEALLHQLLLQQQGNLDVETALNSQNHTAIYDAPLMKLQKANLRTIPFELIKGADRQKTQIFENMQRFFNGLPANHTLLWGARGTGKSSVVKASFQKLLNEHTASSSAYHPLMIEVYAEDTATLPLLVRALHKIDRLILIFCDDLSFDLKDNAYKALKSLLDGGIETLEGKILFYATSNRRHLLPREAESDYQTDAKDARDERISLSDRFGLWIGFHPIDQPCYLEIIDSYFAYFKIDAPQSNAQAIEWSRTRGSLSGRTAWQFFKDYIGQANIKIDLF